MELKTIDYIILGAAGCGGVIGLFVGFSGALALLSGLAAAFFAGRFAWPLSADFVAATWARGCVAALVAILAFGIVRWIVRKFVHGLVAQPGDALLGALSAIVTTLALALALVWGLGLMMPAEANLNSAILQEVLSRVR